MKLLEWEDANPHNAKYELDQLVGLTITGYGYVNGDICDFPVLRVEKDGKPITTDHGDELALLISIDAELNGGGYIGIIDPSEWGSYSMGWTKDMITIIKLLKWNPGKRKRK